MYGVTIRWHSWYLAVLDPAVDAEEDDPALQLVVGLLRALPDCVVGAGP